jgi:hypothetical protein
MSLVVEKRNRWARINPISLSARARTSHRVVAKGASHEEQDDRLSLVLMSILAAIGVACPAASASVAQSATGSGQFEFTSNTGVTALRTFAFEATKGSDGSVSGQAQIDNRAIGQRLHIEIDCLNVIGNIAVISGTLTQAAGTGIAVGDSAIFAAQDNGEGAGAAPDRLRRSFENTGLVCTDITPANVGLYTYLLNDVQAGNVQIH